jgi:hypothetical protein
MARKPPRPLTFDDSAQPQPLPATPGLGVQVAAARRVVVVRVSDQLVLRVPPDARLTFSGTNPAQIRGSSAPGCLRVYHGPGSRESQAQLAAFQDVVAFYDADVLESARPLPDVIEQHVDAAVAAAERPLERSLANLVEAVRAICERLDVDPPL